jgi:hypothetical protein
MRWRSVFPESSIDGQHSSTRVPTSDHHGCRNAKASRRSTFDVCPLKTRILLWAVGCAQFFRTLRSTATTQTRARRVVSHFRLTLIFHCVSDGQPAPYSHCSVIVFSLLFQKYFSLNRKPRREMDHIRIALLRSTRL